ncbi:MAG: Na+:solute symporter [Phycisphaerales bacterium]|jgi:solute:Na+ symporter, SSS family|nr:Na+:solute symporter [Phycisphaerales bacterium]
MELTMLDWAFIFGFFALALGIGLSVARQAGKSSEDFFLSGRNMPWWLLGFSMVATTFSTDTPNFVTNLVRKDGVSGNWMWWAFLLTGMLTVFVYAKLWRRSKVLTDVEFYEIRYSGKTAAFLRGFRALYLGVFFNIMIMGAVSLAAIKIGSVMLGLAPWESILYASIVTVVFSTLGGFKGVLLTDCVLFVVAMIGAVAAAVFAVQHADIGTLTNLFSNEQVAEKLSIIPQLKQDTNGAITDDSLNLMMGVLIVPLAVQWWSVWYPGSEPGGGGYLAQRMLAAKNEKHATGAVLFFNVTHYALRPWPWIIVALCSLVVFPMDSQRDRDAAAKELNSPQIVQIQEDINADPTKVDQASKDKLQALKFQKDGLTALREAFPNTPDDKIGHDLAYPAMLQSLPHGWLGLVLASLVAAYMSTISTHLNWGSSYVVNDFYKRFIKPEAKDKELVLVGRLSTVVMMVIAALFALQLTSALQAFEILLQIGAGTGLLFILRWFWWRVNAISEVVGMVVSFVVAVTLALGPWKMEAWQSLLVGVGITTACWVTATLLTRPTDVATLRSFCKLINPSGPGWRKVYKQAEVDGQPIESVHESVNLPRGILCMVLGSMGVYAALFAVGMFLYGNTGIASILTGIAVVCTIVLMVLWSKVCGDSTEETTA